MFLADMGAEVIKVEKPGRGDDFRTFGPQKDGMGPPFVWTNRNKKSIALDLTKLEGQEIARELAAKSDVVVENFSAGVMQKFRLDYSSLRDQNPRLIYCAVSAYGRTGPAANRLGFDPVAQAESGFMSLTGSPQWTSDKVRASYYGYVYCNDGFKHNFRRTDGSRTYW